MIREGNTQKRIAAAESALKAHSRYQSESGELERHCPEEVLIDLLTDLRHFAVSREVDFDAALRISQTHFAVEQELDLEPRLK
jgi:hypothetical protein